MTVAAYPSELPAVLRASKSRSQKAPFQATPPGAGKLYVQRTGADNPVKWDIEFRFTPAEAVTFQDWFWSDLEGGVLPFTLPIRTEFGVITHTCRFLPDNLLTTRQEGECFTYSASIIARAQAIPAGFLEGAEMIIGLPNWKLWAAMLDQAVTEELPE